METNELKLVIGNSVESLMFAILNNYHFIENRKKYYLWHDCFGTPFDYNALYQCLYMFWTSCNKVVLGADIKQIFITEPCGIKVTTFDNREPTEFSFDHIFLFDDENVYDIPNSILSKDRIYRVIFPFVTTQFIFLKEQLKITTGKKFPQELYLSIREQKDMRFSKDLFELYPPMHFMYYSNSAVSYLTKKEMEDFEFSQKNLKFFFQDFMKHFGGTLTTFAILDKIVENIMLDYKPHKYVTPMSDKNELEKIKNLFWEKFLTFDEENGNENVSNFRTCFNLMEFLKISFKANGFGPIHTLRKIRKEKNENATKIENQMSEIIVKCNSPGESSPN